MVSAARKKPMPVLPEGDAYLLMDLRALATLTSGTLGYTLPAGVEEAERIWSERLKAATIFAEQNWRADDTRWKSEDGLVTSVWGDPNFMPSQSQVPKRIAFKIAKPKQLPPLFYAPFLGRGNFNTFHTLMSPDWASTIQKFDPDKHLWFPVSLEFRDETVEGFSIVREMCFSYETQCRFLETSVVECDEAWRMIMLIGGPGPGRGQQMVIRRPAISAANWIKHGPSATTRFASKELAQILNPLILSKDRNKFYFEPFQLSDD